MIGSIEMCTDFGVSLEVIEYRFDSTGYHPHGHHRLPSPKADQLKYTSNHLKLIIYEQNERIYSPPPLLYRVDLQTGWSDLTARRALTGT